MSKSLKKSTYELPSLVLDATISEFTTWETEAHTTIAAAGLRGILIGTTLEPQDPRYDEDNELIVDEDGQPIEVSEDTMEKFRYKHEEFNQMKYLLWFLLTTACKAQCKSLIQGVEMFDCHTAWDKIQEHFQNTASTSNYFEAKDEFEEVVWDHSLANDSISFQTFIAKLNSAAKTLDEVHGKPMSDEDMIHVLGQRLPPKYSECYRTVTKLPANELTYLNAVAELTKDIRLTLKNEQKLSGGKGGKKGGVEVSNLAKVDKAQRKAAKLAKKKAFKAAKHTAKHVQETTFVAVTPGKPPPGYTGCHVTECKSMDHFARDCPIGKAKKAAAALRLQQYPPHQQYPAYQPAPPQGPPPQQPPYPQYPPPQAFYRGGGNHGAGGRAPSLGRGSYRGRGWHTGGRGGGDSGRGHQQGGGHSYFSNGGGDDNGYSYLAGGGGGGATQQYNIHAAPLSSTEYYYPPVHNGGWL